MGIGDYIMNYLTDEEKYVKGICNNNENMIIILNKTYPNSLLINSFFDDEFSSSSNFILSISPNSPNIFSKSSLVAFLGYICYI